MNTERSAMLVSLGVYDDPDVDTSTVRDALAIIKVIDEGQFVYKGRGQGSMDLFFRRFSGFYVDHLWLDTARDGVSLGLRYERRGYPWPKGNEPEPLRIAGPGTIVDVVRVVVDEWIVLL
ncbi:hypothetical protein [Amycolatopsis vastitatis]|uniref:Uncharacterized protein n=1 Tax=Amycolatopsis vastitatis TaxID=1905142 RepID=A0A229TF83_9PSEU|nr:hypothetical protein [Amycolatopsis vastitatis]OXM69611.1 hypothetical protein CF165_08870 [Amycolatopsis vastitatis]